MLFTEEHIEKVLSGEKTQTRRLWKTNQVKVGNSYRAVNDLFTTRENAPAYILVTDVYQEKLGHITEENADSEGGYTVQEFKELWIDMHGEWDDDEDVWVTDFEGYKEDPRNQ